VSGDGQHVVGMLIKMPVRCHHGYELSLSESWLSYADNVLIENHTVHTMLEWLSSRETKRGTMTAFLNFTAPNTLEGRLRVHLPYRSRRVGLCAGTLSFRATT